MAIGPRILHDPAVANLHTDSPGPPFMYKEDLRLRASAMLGASKVIRWHSSTGSTAEPVLYPWGESDEIVATAVLARTYADRVSFDGGAAFVIAPTGLSSMWGHMERQLRYLGLATVLTGVDSPLRILSLMDLLRPRVLCSLPLVLGRLAELREGAGLGREAQPELLVCGGDVLSVARMQRIERFWGCPVENCYGLSEIFGPLATVTSDPHWLEWRSPETYVELVSPQTGKTIEEGDTGIAVLTTRWDRPSPLTRYWTGDLFKLQRWAEPGRPVFSVRGRESFAPPTALPGFLAVDIDEILLSDPAAGLEWTLEAAPDGYRLLVETDPSGESLDPRTIRSVQNGFAVPVHVTTVPGGSLDRSYSKLATRRLPLDEA